MPKQSRRSRSSTWYRHLNRELDSIFKSINNNSSVSLPLSNDNAPNDYDSSFDTSNVATVSSSDIHDADILLDDLQFDYFFNSDSEDGENTSNNNVQINLNVSTPISKTVNTTDSLKHWSVHNKITHTALKELLGILSTSTATDISTFQNLPKDPRTFLNTPRSSIISFIDPGNYCHIGLKNTLEWQYQNLNLKPSGMVIEIGINIDGLPLAKSTSSQLYPILCINKSLNHVNNVSLIGIYHGYEKPSSFNDFLFNFVTEVTELINNGIVLFGKVYTLKISMFLFDAVAKASILYIKGHSGYSSCTKCFQVGEYIKDRVCFPDLNFTKRTHESFILKSDPDHHTGDTLLANIPNINLIDDIPLDYMHLVMLGVVKKILVGIWCCGSPPHKLPFMIINRISQNLESISKYIPSEFARKPRGLKEVKRWKATEFRQFLLYTGPIVLKNNISNTKYRHFLTLTVSISLLLSEKFCNLYVNYAEELLQHFVQTTKSLYGLHFLTHNFHNLLHLCDDVRKFGSLEKFNNFSSENYLQKLLGLVRKHDNPLIQIVRRIQEINVNLINPACKTISEFELVQQYSGGILVEGCTGPEFKAVMFQNFKLSLAVRDCCCMLKSNIIVEIKNFAFSPCTNSYVIIGQNYTERNDFFNIPCESSSLGIHFVKNLSPLSFWPLSEIDIKLIRFPYSDGFVTYPFLHLT